jgi:diaminopimelate epimerase
MGALANQSFVKMNGIGNEIVVVDLRAGGARIEAAEARAAAGPAGAPYDQLMALYQPRTAGTDAFIRIFNNDGSEAGACGNGMRCVADLVSRESGKSDLTFETTAGRAPTVNSPLTWGRRASSGMKFRWLRNSAIRAPSNCRSDRSTSRCCIRHRL